MAEKDGETVGAALTLPDYNQVLRHMNGRILPFGWLAALRHRKDIDRVRVFALGRQAGVAAHRRGGQVLRAPLRRGGASRRRSTGEMGWILETNKNMNRAMEAMGGRVVRRFRLYERVFG